MQVFDFELSDEDMKVIESFNVPFRVCIPMIEVSQLISQSTGTFWQSYRLRHSWKNRPLYSQCNFVTRITKILACNGTITLLKLFFFRLMEREFQEMQAIPTIHLIFLINLSLLQLHTTMQLKIFDIVAFFHFSFFFTLHCPN